MDPVVDEVSQSAHQADAAPPVPDYMLDPDAIVKDDVTWRYGQPPDYSKTRRIYRESECVLNRLFCLFD